MRATCRPIAAVVLSALLALAVPACQDSPQEKQKKGPLIDIDVPGASVEVESTDGGVKVDVKTGQTDEADQP